MPCDTFTNLKASTEGSDPYDALDGVGPAQ